VYPVAQTIARNSKEFPSTGFEAVSVMSPVKLNIIPPDTAIKKPHHPSIETFSEKKIKEPIHTRIGNIEVIIPA